MFYETHEISRFSSTIILIILIHEKGKKDKSPLYKGFVRNDVRTETGRTFIFGC